MAKRAPAIPLDQLSAIVMIANMGEGDLVHLFGPFGARFTTSPAPRGEVGTRTVWRLAPAFADRLYCRDHLLLVMHRLAAVTSRDKAVDWLQEMYAVEDVEKAVRASHIRVYGVRRPSTKTWDQCPHCRWKERNLERLRQSRD